MLRPLTVAALGLVLALMAGSASATVPWSREQIRAFERSNPQDLPPFQAPQHTRPRQTLDDEAYFLHFQMLCDFLVSMQYSLPGQNHGGMIEGESGSDHNIIETDNTQESIREWSQYAIWTGDTARYRPNIQAAQQYCGIFPAWHEGDNGGLDFYSAHNCGWGFEAVRKYREAYGDTSWNWYADSCAVWMNAHSLNWGGDMVDAYAEALGIGGMYHHAVYRGRQDWIDHCINRGRALRTWLAANPARLHSESWALCGGTAVWGLSETLFAAYPDSGAMWVQQWGSQVQYWESAGAWNHSFSSWYANAQHRMFELSGDSVYWNNAVYTGDSLIHLDQDDDGGIMPGQSFPNTNDHSWVSCYMGWMGLERIINHIPGYDGTVVAFASPDAHLPHLAGDTMFVSVRLGSAGWEPISGRVIVSGANNFLDSADVDLSYGTDTTVTMSRPWVVPDDASLPDSSYLTALFVSIQDLDPSNDTLTAGFNFRHGVQITGAVTDAANPNGHIPATIKVYHEAYPDSVWTTFEAPGDANYVSGPRPLLEGVNRIVVEPAVQFMDGNAQVNIPWESSPLQVNFSLNHTQLALIDDDGGQTYETWYLSSLDSFPGLNVRRWDRSANTIASLSGIPTAIWFCGDDSTNTLDAEDQILLENYLSSGGDLLLTGQNIADDAAAAPFLTSVLACSLHSTNANSRAATGVPGNPISGGALLILTGSGGAWNQTSPASIYAMNGSTEILHYTSGDDGVCGVSGYHGGGQYVFLSFGLEAASAGPSSWSRDEFLAHCFAWFDSANIVLPRPEVPLTIRLAQNYPNPFNPATTIRFTAPPAAGPITLIVYNLLGQEVRRLYEGPGIAGEVSVTWDGLTDAGSMAASGLYVYRLHTSSGEFSHSLQLLR